MTYLGMYPANLSQLLRSPFIVGLINKQSYYEFIKVSLDIAEEI